MSRSEDLVIVRAELASLTDSQRGQLDMLRGTLPLPRGWANLDLPGLIQRYRQEAAGFGADPKMVRSRQCPCGLCLLGRALDGVGLL